jgi:hypothetical protein
MLRLTRIAMLLALAAGCAGASLPAAAASVANCNDEKVIGPDGTYIDKVQAFADTIAIELRQQGYNVESVEPWGGCVRAFISDGGGRSHMQFFDPDTLEPLTTN